MMARSMAEGGMSPAEISAKTGIPEPVCDAAAAEPKMSPQQAADAQTYYDSVYGKNSTQRNQILNDLKTNPADVQKAAADYNAIKDDPHVSAAEKQAKLDAWRAAYDKMQRNYQDYRNLPEEADAWATGNAAEQAFKNAPKPDPAGARTEPLGDPSTAKTQPLGDPSTAKTEPLGGRDGKTGGNDTTKPAQHDEPGKTSEPPGKGPQSSPDRARLPADQQATYDKAWEFYRSQGMADERIEGHLRGIDFSRPVEVTKIPKGTLIQQTQPPGAPQGSYYAPPGTEPSKLGISPKGDLRGPDGDTVVGHVDKSTRLYVTTEDIVVLKSWAAEINDTWSMHDVGTSSRDGTPIPFLAEGGGIQYFTTEKPPIQPYEPTAREPSVPRATDPAKVDPVHPESAPMAEDPSKDPSLEPPGPEGDHQALTVEPNNTERLKALADAINDLRTDNAKRNEVLETLRTPNNGEPGPLEGHVLDTALDENKAAIRDMVQSFKDNPPDVIVGMKEGGAFLADVLGTSDPALAGKVHEMDVHKATGDAAKKGKFDQDPMLQEFEVLIQGGARKIAIVDTYMGGRTAGSLRDQIMKPLAEKYPDVTFDVHWLRETMGFQDGPLRGTVKPGQKGGTQISTSEHQVRMAIGDDMTMVYDATSTKPVTIFDRNGQVVKTFYPAEGQTSRDVIIALLTGRLTP
ncbi:MAG: hypothetical protein E6J90_05695 [Deltaproteobacteria bacterium]|nr:MAG: hypothetical protein E6J90_05695 [Deltaproteobacteria bacterium]